MKLFVRSSNTDRLKDWDDHRLLQAWQEEGKRAAFDLLYERYIHLVYGTCRKFVEDADACRDISMQVFQTLSDLPADQSVQSFPNWFFTTARNRCISHLRRPDNQVVLEPEEKYFEKSADGFMENEGLTRLLNREHPHLLDLIPDAIEQLEADQRRCLKLFFYENLSYKDISQQTGFSLKQVKSYLQNGKRNLGILLKKQAGEGPSPINRS
jgi:RNA polymerase sigma-70 factor (ECF subfamily)